MVLVFQERENDGNYFVATFEHEFKLGDLQETKVQTENAQPLMFEIYVVYI